MNSSTELLPDGGQANSEDGGHFVAQVVLLWALATILILWTMVGNFTIWMMVSRSKKLRSASNYLIANLAASDFLLGISVLPFSAVYDVLRYWPFGRAACVYWLVADVLLCTASIWSLLVIAADRYSATFYPHWYRGNRWQRRVIFYIAAVWVASFLTSVPPIFGLGDTVNDMYVERADDRHACVLFQNVEYVLYSACMTFYLPSVALFSIYARIFAEIHRRSRLLRGLRDKSDSERRRAGGEKPRLAALEAAAAAARNAAASAADDGCREKLMTRELGRLRIPLASPETLSDLSAPANESSSSASEVYSYSEADRAGPYSSPAKLTLLGVRHEVLAEPAGRIAAACSPTERMASCRQLGLARTAAKRKYEVREQKATKVMVTIVICFVACWLPFFVVYTLRALCRSCATEIVQVVVIWLGYANSAINPILYSAFNQEFREALRQRRSCAIRRRRRHRVESNCAAAA